MLSRGGDFAEIFVESRIETALSFEGETLEVACTGARPSASDCA